ncbi:hypothetical protein [Aneurinibacillus sp. REN35]|uniref:hypothetical protein n=1 Tax=Aneurinibacillus sp. REN35 TaxID=3237286 RepID=UPI00352789C0
MEFIVRGATLVNPERCFTADVWIKDEMIHYIHEHIPPKPPIKEIDGSACYMLPGFFHFGTSLGSQRMSVQELKSTQEQWCKKGITSYVDDLMITYDSNWRTRLGYELAMHHNSWLAHWTRLRVPYRSMNESLIRAVLAHPIPMLELIFQPSEQPVGSFWSLLLNGFARRRKALKLSFADECTERDRKRWIAEHLPMLVSMLEYRGIPLVLDERADMLACVNERKMACSRYITWEVNRNAELSYERKQFGTYDISSINMCKAGVEKALQRLVNAASRQPARLFGAYPQKGALVPGTEADFFLIEKNFFGNPATFLAPSFVYTKGRRNRHLIFTETDTKVCNIAL